MTLLNLTQKILKKIKPSEKELKQEKQIVQEILNKIKNTKGKQIKTEWLGSSARNTHLKGSRDLDIFVLFPKNMPRNQFEKEGLRIAKNVFEKGKWHEEYSEHPYIRGNYKGFEIDVVPSYLIENTSQLQSAVDRSPFHNAWLKKNQKEKHKDATRLLKAFLKGMNAYGAKLKFNSVPGYLTELLIIKYGSFEKTIKAISEWENFELIQFNSEYSKKEANQKFDHHLIVIDPTDKNRNVASALSFNQFARIISATRAYIQKPSDKFFLQNKRKPMSLTQAKKFTSQKNILALKIKYPKKTVSDIVYGQIKRFAKKTAKHFELNDFHIMRFDQWTDEKEEIIFLFELKAIKLEKVRKHFGPYVTNKKHSEAFLKDMKKFITGPWIENGRWVVEKKRENYSAKQFLQKYTKTEGKKEKMPLKKCLTKTTVFEANKLLQKYKKDKEFARFYSRFLKGKEEFFLY